MNTKLCNINDIEDPGSKGFTVGSGRRTRNIFIVKQAGQVYGYNNKCPHANINLEWLDDEFLDNDKTLIQCSVHGALFYIDSGDCAGGPCNGHGLKKIDLSINQNGDIFLS
jgi:nitrite reductase/ring-hydroxylating ferredoxin subunit